MSAEPTVLNFENVVDSGFGRLNSMEK